LILCFVDGLTEAEFKTSSQRERERKRGGGERERNRFKICETEICCAIVDEINVFQNLLINQLSS
jgi:hypothetical protein